MDSKVKKVLDALAQGRGLDEVADSLGYANRKSVSQYMRRKGYSYNREMGTYVLDGIQSDTKSSVLQGNGDVPNKAQELLSRADEVLRLLDGGTGALADSLSSPLLRGYPLVKSFRLPHRLCEAVESFAHHKRITQKAIFEAALVEFLARRGGIPDEDS